MGYRYLVISKKGRFRFPISDLGPDKEASAARSIRITQHAARSTQHAARSTQHAPSKLKLEQVCSCPE